jgi:hypothetical protein
MRLAYPVAQVVVDARVMDLPAASASTGEDGRYALPLLPAGTHVLAGPLLRLRFHLVSSSRHVQSYHSSDDGNDANKL